MKLSQLFSVLAASIAMSGSFATGVTETIKPGVSAVIPGETRSLRSAVMESRKSETFESFVGNAPVSHRFEMAKASPEVSLRKSSAVVAEKRGALQIGFGRPVPESAQVINFSSLIWQTNSSGVRTARMSFDVAEAEAFRVGMVVKGPVDGLRIRFANDEQAKVYQGAPLEAGAKHWSPIMEGGRGIAEFAIAANRQPSDFTLLIDTISELTMSNLTNNGRKARSEAACPGETSSNQKTGIGCAESCNIDFSCVQNPSQALLEIGRATARIFVTRDSDGATLVCTGTLLNSNSSPKRPYFFTAAHCVDSQREAASVQSFWFFDSVACNSTSTPPFQRLTTGASLRVVDVNLDGSLLELNDVPPNGAVFAAWDASIIPTNAASGGTVLVGLHHPSGDLKMFSEGTMQGYGIRSSPTDSLIRVRWSAGKGTTEQGSSGSGIFTYRVDCGDGLPCYQLRGGLEGGGASCATPTSPDYYSRLDLMYTLVAPYLNPGDIIPTSNSSVASMVEFYNPRFDYYFMTSREAEKTALDDLRNTQGRPEWYRTGYWFKVDPFSSPSTSSLTRYFIPGAAKNQTRGSHFYTALNADKQAITETGKERSGSACDTLPNTWFCNEGTDSYVAAPVGTGSASTCLSGERPVWRVFRGAPNYFDDGNHRYVTSQGMYDYMVRELGWTAEFVNFCARP